MLKWSIIIIFAIFIIFIDNLHIVKYLHLAQVNIYYVEMMNYHILLLFSVIIILIII